MLKIEKLNIKWNGTLKPLELSKVDSIALHHMAHPTAGPYDIDMWHKSNGWAGFGYGFWVAKDGTIYEGRGFNQNAAVADNNGHIISIGFQGEYEKIDKEMPVLQYNAGVEIIKYVLEKVPTVKTISGHNRWNNTSCPGRYFPLNEMVTAAHQKEPEHWAEKYHKYLEDHGIVIHEKRYDDPATRGDMFAMMARLKGYKEG